ncbi:MAG: hypothetical protein ABI402_21160 [Ferruginibacter sp.]
MSNIKTKIDEWEVRDLEDNSTISVYVEHNTEMGNKSLPGIQVWSGGNIVNFEPLHVERWAYAAKKANQSEYLIADSSWMAYEDTYVKYFLVTGEKLKAKIAVKVRSKDKEIVKEYELPFVLED